MLTDQDSNLNCGTLNTQRSNWSYWTMKTFCSSTVIDFKRDEILNTIIYIICILIGSKNPVLNYAYNYLLVSQAGTYMFLIPKIFYN